MIGLAGVLCLGFVDISDLVVGWGMGYNKRYG